MTASSRRSYRVTQGAVFFVDILGISELTRGKVPLDNVQMKCYEIQGLAKSAPHQKLAAWLLQHFRMVLSEIALKYRNVRISQLSDCAFFWSSDRFAVLMAASECMWAALLNGILVRGGLATGEILEPYAHKVSLGQFILGEAVTRAAN